MRPKKLGAALVVLAALGAVLASSAFAAAVTSEVEGGGMARWYTGAEPGALLKEKVGETPAETRTITASQVGTGTFTTKVSGTEIVLHATGTECIECKIENSGGVAVGSGKLKFTGVTVEKPAKCTTVTSIETKALSVTADWMIGETDYVKFVPAKGEETEFAQFSLTGAECALKTTIIPKGSVFVEAENKTKAQKASQRVKSSGAINTTAGGNLHVGTEAATLEATADFSIPVKEGEPAILFGTH